MFFYFLVKENRGVLRMRIGDDGSADADAWRLRKFSVCKIVRRQWRHYWTSEEHETEPELSSVRSLSTCLSCPCSLFPTSSADLATRALAAGSRELAREPRVHGRSSVARSHSVLDARRLSLSASDILVSFSFLRDSSLLARFFSSSRAATLLLSGRSRSFIFDHSEVFRATEGHRVGTTRITWGTQVEEELPLIFFFFFFSMIVWHYMSSCIGWYIIMYESFLRRYPAESVCLMLR